MDDPIAAMLLDIVGEEAAHLGLTMRRISVEEFEEKGRRSFLRSGRRFHITVTAPGDPKTSCWPLSEDAARAFFAGAVDRHRERSDVIIKLVDEVTRETLAVWPEEDPWG